MREISLHREHAASSIVKRTVIMACVQEILQEYEDEYNSLIAGSTKENILDRQRRYDALRKRRPTNSMQKKCIMKEMNELRGDYAKGRRLVRVIKMLDKWREKAASAHTGRENITTTQPPVNPTLKGKYSAPSLGEEPHTAATKPSSIADATVKFRAPPAQIITLSSKNDADGGMRYAEIKEEKCDTDESESDSDENEIDECFLCHGGGGELAWSPCNTLHFPAQPHSFLYRINKPELILCDGDGCDKAYHVSCVNVDINTLPLIWYCPSCKNSEKNLEAKRKRCSHVGVPRIHGAEVIRKSCSPNRGDRKRKAVSIEASRKERRCHCLLPEAGCSQRNSKASI